MGISIKQKVYLLYHSYEEDGEEDSKLLGVFSSKEKAQEVIKTHKLLPGFKDHLEGFLIDEYLIDKSEWNEGFGFD